MHKNLHWDREKRDDDHQTVASVSVGSHDLRGLARSRVARPSVRWLLAAVLCLAVSSLVGCSRSLPGVRVDGLPKLQTRYADFDGRQVGIKAGKSSRVRVGVPVSQRGKPHGSGSEQHGSRR